MSLNQKKEKKLAMYKDMFQGLSWSIFRDLEDKVIASTQFVDLKNNL